MRKTVSLIVVLAVMAAAVAAFAGGGTQQVAHVNGVVKSILRSADGKTVTGFIVTKAHNTDVTVNVDANTIYRKGRHDAATVGEVQVGMRVLALFPGTDPTVPAKIIKILAPPPPTH